MSERRDGTAVPGTFPIPALQPQGTLLRPATPAAREVLRLPVSRTTTVTLSVEGAPLTVADVQRLQQALQLVAVASGDPTAGHWIESSAGSGAPSGDALAADRTYHALRAEILTYGCHVDTPASSYCWYCGATAGRGRPTAHAPDCLWQRLTRELLEEGSTTRPAPDEPAHR